MNTDTLITLLAFKRWSDAHTLQAIQTIDASRYAEKRHLMLRLMNHIYVVDRIFSANLLGQPHGYTALNTPETPTTETLAVSMAACTDDIIARVSGMDAAALDVRIAFTFVDGGQGEMSAMEMLNHLLFHGAYHRGAVGWLIGECDGVPPKEVLTVFLRDHLA